MLTTKIVFFDWGVSGNNISCNTIFISGYRVFSGITHTSFGVSQLGRNIKLSEIMSWIQCSFSLIVGVYMSRSNACIVLLLVVYLLQARLFVATRKLHLHECMWMRYNVLQQDSVIHKSIVWIQQVLQLLHQQRRSRNYRNS